jgi:hypothetical protein
LEEKKRHDFDCFASKRNSKNLKQKKRELSVSSMLRQGNLEKRILLSLSGETKSAQRN